MRQAITIEMIRDVGEILVRLLVGVLVALSLEDTLAVLEAASKDDLRTGFGHGVVGQRTNALVAGLQMVGVRGLPLEG